MSDDVAQTILNFSKKRVSEPEEYELWLSRDQMVPVYIRQLSCDERDYLSNKYGQIITADIESLSFFDRYKQIRYPYEIVSMVLVKPEFTIDQLQQLDVWTFNRLYTLVTNVLSF